MNEKSFNAICEHSDEPRWVVLVDRAWQMHANEVKSQRWADRNWKQICLIQRTGGTINTINKRCTFQITRTIIPLKWIRTGARTRPNYQYQIISVERLLAFRNVADGIACEMNGRQTEIARLLYTCLMWESAMQYVRFRCVFVPAWNPTWKICIDEIGRTSNICLLLKIAAVNAWWPGAAGWLQLCRISYLLSLNFYFSTKNVTPWYQSWSKVQVQWSTVKCEVNAGGFRAFAHLEVATGRNCLESFGHLEWSVIILSKAHEWIIRIRHTEEIGIVTPISRSENSQFLWKIMWSQLPWRLEW